MPGAGFEPARPKPGDFKSPAFTISPPGLLAESIPSLRDLPCYRPTLFLVNLSSTERRAASRFAPPTAVGYQRNPAMSEIRRLRIHVIRGDSSQQPVGGTLA